MSNIDAGNAMRLLNSGVVCERLGGIRRETLSRGKGRTYPPPDRVINGRNYWLERTYWRTRIMSAFGGKADVKVGKADIGVSEVIRIMTHPARSIATHYRLDDLAPRRATSKGE